MDSADANDSHNTNDAGDLTCFASGCVLALTLDCTHAAGQDDPTGAAALRVAVWERQKALKDDAVGSVVGPDIQLSTLLVSTAACPDVVTLKISPLNGRDRAGAKARDEYKDKTAPCYSWLFDITRGAALCQTEDALVSLYKALERTTVWISCGRRTALRRRCSTAIRTS
mgnify:CR=1 FL=1